MKLLKYLQIGAVVAGLAVVPAQVAQAAVITPKTDMGSAVVIQAKTGQVLADQNGNERLPIASVSKLIVVYMLEQKIQKNELSLDQKVTIPEDIAKFSQDSSVANVPMTTSRTYTISQILDATLIESSNAGAMELAHLVAGSQENYYQQAEKLLTSWGIKNPKMYSASGLRNGDLASFEDKSVAPSAENKFSAREISLISKHLVDDYPQITTYTQKKEANFPLPDGSNMVLKNTNLLLGNKQYHIDGLKTGLTPNNGSNLVSHGTLNHQPVITVVLNTNDHPRQEIFNQTLSVLGQVQDQTKLQAPQTKQSVKIDNAEGNHGQVALKAGAGQQYFVKQTDDTVSINAIKPKANVAAPLQTNDVVATGRVSFSQKADDDFIDGKTPQLKLYPTQGVKKANLFTTLIQKVS
ncbi:D-alanyl-D-alanine carboxypeptidase [Weissella viridescens]|uniref:D-alanyl-D-alanine carboxypeptidase n=1 Tax=Weissella viridescens TaxID=1629 RepID=A0A3P2RAG9_WEIVI|nr:serine hydrolase [Weissella viridescens]RRG17829.1 D-alanyl-D-alanine carboxypeptidase [Weissella viridescens]